MTWLLSHRELLTWCIRNKPNENEMQAYFLMLLGFRQVRATQMPQSRVTYPPETLEERLQALRGWVILSHSPLILDYIMFSTQREHQKMITDGFQRPSAEKVRPRPPPRKHR